MKKIDLIFVLLLVVLCSTNYAQDSENNYACPVENISKSHDITADSNWTYPVVFNWNFENIGNPGMISGAVGAMYFQYHYYFNRWNSPIIYRYDGGLEGPGSFLDSISYMGSIKDLTTDGEYLYGGIAKSTVYTFDADGNTLDSVALGSPAVVRAIAYTPDEFGFYVCNYNDNIILCDAITGSVVRVLTGTNTLNNKYGMAYSNLTEEGPILWVWGQGTNADPYNNLWKVNPITGGIIAKYRFGPLSIQTGTNSLSGLAGGAEVCVINQTPILLLNFQNYALVGYKLGGVLPVELIKFTAKNEQNKVILNWSTASETNNRGFEIQRAPTDGIFHTIGFVNGTGTSTEKHNYSYTDKMLKEGKYTYRLRQVDFNGSSEYSQVINVEVNIPIKFELFQNYPNPFNPNTTITFNLAFDSRVSVKIINLIGQEVTVLVNSEMNAGTHSIKVDATNLASGIYIYKLDTSGKDGSAFTAVKKMMLIK